LIPKHLTNPDEPNCERSVRAPQAVSTERVSDEIGLLVSAFAEENKLATIVERRRPGRLLSGSAYKVGHGYILGLPVAAYLTWQGQMLANNGIVPKFCIELSRALREERDSQLEKAIDVAKTR
jgi:C-terminal processing protease CtpA/Prc